MFTYQEKLTVELLRMKQLTQKQKNTIATALLLTTDSWLVRAPVLKGIERGAWKLDSKLIRDLVRSSGRKVHFELLLATSYLHEFPADVFETIFFLTLRETKNREAKKLGVLADILRSFLSSHPDQAAKYEKAIRRLIRHRAPRVRKFAVEGVCNLRTPQLLDVKVLVGGLQSKSANLKLNCANALRYLMNHPKRLDAECMALLHSERVQRHLSLDDGR